jgi:serine/threonine protein kinase/formylglycine-generating enzyme required for sulfatase activity
MSESNRHHETSLPPKLIPLLENACDRFEAALKAGERPRIEFYLESMPEPGWSVLLRELLRLELAYRVTDSDRPKPEEYVARFPGEEEVVRAAFLTLGPGDSTVDFHPAPDSIAPPSRPEWIGRYRIERLAGQGGFGLVYVAQDEQLNRPVAIKVAHARQVGRPEDVEAYIEEARIVASLDHPHIVPVYDVGSTQQFPCFVVSKFIDGENLATRIGEECPTSEEAAELVATVAEALHYAHTRGLVHRDVKPGNILIDTWGRAFVTDFGLALKEEDFGEGGGLAGTPSYMSPEQAKGEGHRVDGRSDIFSLGVVFYELLTGRRPFVSDAEGKNEALKELLDLIATTEPRPPRQLDDAIPKELERICLKAMAKRATDRFTTARDMAEDLREYLKTASGAVSPVTWEVAPSLLPGSTQEKAPVPSLLERLDSDQQPIKIVPKGLRSFDEHDADFFLELLPGPRDRHGLPESIRFWKSRIEVTDSDKSFKVGLIYGPSGCGKSSMVKAGLLPRLSKNVLPVYVEATAQETENRLLKRSRKVCPDLPTRLGLVDSFSAVRKGRILRSGQKVLVVVDQFEQWLHGKRGEENTELVSALRQCDGEHLQSLMMVRDDFWMAATRFMRQLETDLVPGQNIAAVDLFDAEHAKKVLAALGTAYGKLPERARDRTPQQHAFLNQAISELTQDRKVISVRLALFAEMVKGKLWTPATLREVGGTEGVGVTFLEETFGSSEANPKHRLHQKAAQAVLKALLPEISTEIKGQLRSERDLQDASGYAGRLREFAELMHVLDNELRLITPAEEKMKDEGGRMNDQNTKAEVVSSDSSFILHPSSFRFYQLTHDYLVPSLRDWLTRKQRETRRGRAQLRLAERSALWNAKPENRRLPSVLEWANIRALARKREWTDPQRRMMRRAGRVHGLRALGLTILIALLTWGAIESYGTLRGLNLVEKLQAADTAEVAPIIKQLSAYRRWGDIRLRRVLRESGDSSRDRLRASLALLEVDGTQADFLLRRLLTASPDELPVIRQFLEPHKASLTSKLWPVLESAQPGDASLLPAASALALYDSQDPRWREVGANVAEAIVQVSAFNLRAWMEALRPVRVMLTGPLVAIFRDKDHRSETARSLATDVLTVYASDDPALIASLVMDSDPTAYRSLFAAAEKNTETVLPVFRAELTKRAALSWDDVPINQSWTKPDAALLSRIESAEGILAERFAFCQTMPLDEFLTTAEALRKAGYRPVRFRPYADEKVVRVAAVWIRDGRNWQISSGLTADEIRQQDEWKKKGKFLPVDVAGYVTTGAGDRASDRYASIWAERTRDDDALMYVGLTTAQEIEVESKLRGEGLITRTLHNMTTSDGQKRYCGVWGRRPGTAVTGRTYSDQFQCEFDQHLAMLSAQLLEDVALGATSKPQTARDQAKEAFENAERKIQRIPYDADPRFSRVMANLRLGEDQKALDEVQSMIQADPHALPAREFKVIALTHLGKNADAQSELAKLQKEDAPESSKLFLSVVVAAAAGAGLDNALGALEAGIKKQPANAELRYKAARAFSLASRDCSSTDKAKSRQFAERSLQLLREAVKNDDADFGRMDEDPDLDPIRQDPSFTEIMKAGHPERRYAAVWTTDANFEAIPIYGLDPPAHLQKCRELVAQGYRPVSLSLARTTAEGPLVTGSVWQRPVISEETKDGVAERQARAAISLVRLGNAEEVWALLRHSPDPRVRSFILNWLNPLGADPNKIAAQLEHVDRNAKPTVVQGRQFMDEVLFHPETSMRRALILALGTYEPDGLSPGERESLISKLLDLYRNDPDAGIHGATDWTLRKWGQQDKITEVDGQLTKLKDRGGRRWYVNKHGQTFTVVDGPVEFGMGSPASDTERLAPNEPPRRMVIPRTFAIAAKEVTAEQFRRFTKLNPIHSVRSEILSPHNFDPGVPTIVGPWYAAAAYCNWLSEQEGLPKDQWCFIPNEAASYSAGMSVPPDSLLRKGYRLPTEAEWEYACRAGAVTNRYYGASIKLLGSYAWYQANSKRHAWQCGSLLPNDLGLFDTLGNMFEWCLDLARAERRIKKGRDYDSMILSDKVGEHVVSETGLRRYRGGSFDRSADASRSASRFGNLPSLNITSVGFRLARTHP